MDKITINQHVERVMRVSSRIKRPAKFHPKTVVSVGSAKIGGVILAWLPAPAAWKTRDQMVEVAQRVKAAGASMLRGGAFKPPHLAVFVPGYGYQGLDLLLLAKEASGLPIVTELMSPKYIDLFREKWMWCRSARQHAELRSAQGSGQNEQTDSAQARPVQYL